MSRFSRQAAIVLIRLYRRTLSPDHGPLRRFFPHGCCVHRPTCSEYGERVIAEHGVRKGAALLWRRMLTCRA